MRVTYVRRYRTVPSRAHRRRDPPPAPLEEQVPDPEGIIQTPFVPPVLDGVEEKAPMPTPGNKRGAFFSAGRCGTERQRPGDGMMDLDPGVAQGRLAHAGDGLGKGVASRRGRRQVEPGHLALPVENDLDLREVTSSRIVEQGAGSRGFCRRC